MSLLGQTVICICENREQEVVLQDLISIGVLMDCRMPGGEYGSSKDARLPINVSRYVATTAEDRVVIVDPKDIKRIV